MTNTIKISENNYHREGSYAEVYRVKDLAIKCPFGLTTGERIEKEFEIHKQLFEEGLPVAEPYEIIIAELPNRTVKSISMKFIEGERSSELGIFRKIIASGLYYRELSRAVHLGFVPFEAEIFNSIYNKKDGIYLIDFEHWGRAFRIKE